MTDWAETSLGIAIIAWVTLRVRAVCKWAWNRKGWNWKSDGSGPTLPPANPGSMGYQEQAARAIYDVERSLSQCAVIMERLERFLGPLEKTMVDIRNHLKNASDRPETNVRPFEKKGMG